MRYVGIGLVYGYRYSLGLLFPASCKYHPSCSQYAVDALRKYGLVRVPLVAQFPVFIGLYYTLRAFSKNPPSGNLSWLHVVPNIAAHANSHWSGYLLLAIYAISQMASTFLMGTTMDKTQRTLLLIMPLVFLAVVARFPAGLVLYWMTTNLWTVGQGLITRPLVPQKGEAPAPERRSPTPPRGRGSAR